MDWLGPLALILACQIGLILSGVPVFFAFLAVVFGAALFVFPGTIGVTLLSRSLVEGLSRFVLLPPGDLPDSVQPEPLLQALAGWV